jgi:hypothetical protein
VHELVHGHEFDRRHAEAAKLGDGCGVSHAGVGAPQPLRDVRVAHRESPDVALVHHGLMEVARFVVELRAGWASVVRLCDGFGVVEGSGLEGRGEGGELPVAFDSAVLLFGGEEARGGPAQAHVGGPFAV